jgi:hypothetical protein
MTTKAPTATATYLGGLDDGGGGRMQWLGVAVVIMIGLNLVPFSLEILPKYSAN